MDEIKKKKNEPLYYTDHPRPKTRREFLAQGFIGFSAASMIPADFGFGGLGRAYGQSDCVSGNAVELPFMAFDMAGGAALPGNFLVGGRGGPEDLLPSYDKLGWNPRASGALNQQFGLPMAAGVSGLLQGILQTTNANTQANFRMASICHSGQDDTRRNKLNSLPLVTAAGVRGIYVGKGLGIRNSASGGNSDTAYPGAQYSPVFVGSVSDVQNAVNFGGETLSEMDEVQLRAIAEGSFDTSREQWEKYLDDPQGDDLRRLTECAYEQNLTLLDGVDGIDPRNDPNAQQVYGINANSPGGDGNVVAATIAFNSVNGQSGPGCWTLGGCDYHNGTSTLGDSKDLEMGQQIGRALQLAAQLNRPFFFQLLTDGGCDNRQGTRIWTSDSGIRSMTVMGFYNPAAVPRYRSDDNEPRHQIGHYTNGQGVDGSTLIGGNPQLAAYAVFANYLNVLGRINEFETYLPGVFTPEQLDSLLAFEEDQV